MTTTIHVTTLPRPIKDRLAGALASACARTPELKVPKAPQAQPAALPVATVIKRGADRQWMSERMGDLPDGTYSLYLAAQPVDTRKVCTCDGAGRGPGRACVVKAGERIGELWRCAEGQSHG